MLDEKRLYQRFKNDGVVRDKTIYRYRDRILVGFMTWLFLLVVEGKVHGKLIPSCRLVKLREITGFAKIGGMSKPLYNYAEQDFMMVTEKGFSIEDGHSRLSKVWLKKSIDEYDPEEFAKLVDIEKLLPNRELEYRDTKINKEQVIKYMKDKNNSIQDRIVAAVMLRVAGEDGMLREYISDNSKFREYLIGMNLQSCSSSLRKAALYSGKPLYEYDIVAAVYSYYLGIGKRYEIETPFIEKYVNNRDGIRQHLSKELKVNITTVKQLLNAMGFGARLSANKKTTIARMLKGRIDLKEAVKDPILKGIYQEIKTIGKKMKILEEYSDIKEITFRKSSSFMSYCYQRAERQVMDKVVKELKIQDGYKVHDCVYTNRSDIIDNMNKIIQDEWGEHARFEIGVFNGH